jgi:uncharacterized protein (DUF433 family)
MPDLRRTRRLLVSDPDIFGGEPMLRGTGVRVHIVAALIMQDLTETWLERGYPEAPANNEVPVPTEERQLRG